MIDAIEIRNFKSYREAKLKLGHLNFFIGANASGKSNCLEALRALQGVAGGLAVASLFNGEARALAGTVWTGVRGGLRDIPFRPARGTAPPAASDTTLSVGISVPEQPVLEYAFSFAADGRTTREHLRSGNVAVFDFNGQDALFDPGASPAAVCYPSPFDGSQMLLGFRTGFAGRREAEVRSWGAALTGMQFLVLDPAVLRQYGSGGPVRRMGERGENFATVVHKLDLDAKAAFVSWLRELRPDEVTDAGTKPGAGDDVMFRLCEDDREFLAPVVSEGTLRFAAVAAAFFQPDPPSLLAIEEVDNGIHASRLRLLVELLRSQAARGPTQVLATTHSPFLLAWLRPEEYATTFLCRRDPETGESKICSLSEMPHFAEIIRKQSLSDLVAEGWLESAL